jgi:hypothetical protein
MNRHGPLVALTVVAVAMSIVLSACFAVGRLPGELMATAVFNGFALAFVLWMELDARKRGILPCYDFGFLAMFVFPASLAWYVFWSRGLRGVFLLLGLLGLMVLPWVSAFVTWVLVHGRG